MRCIKSIAAVSPLFVAMMLEVAFGFAPAALLPRSRLRPPSSSSSRNRLRRPEIVCQSQSTLGSKSKDGARSVAVDLLHGLNVIRKPSSVPLLAGNSKKAKKLRGDVHLAAKDRSGSSVIFTGEEGLGTETLVPAISDHHDLYRFECSSDSFRTIFGTGSEEGLLDMLAEKNATIFLTNLQNCNATPDELAELATTFASREYFSRFRSKTVHITAQLIADFEQEPKEFASRGAATRIRVPPLRSRSADIPYMVAAMLVDQRKRAPKQDSTVKLTESREAVRRLQAHVWPKNLEELWSVVRGAATSASSRPDGVIAFNDVSIDSYQDQARVRLFAAFPWLRNLVRADFVWTGFQSSVVVPLFLIVNAALIWGPQTRESNAALTVFWAWWWPGVMISYVFVSRMWCSVCPFSSTAKLFQDFVRFMGWELRKWPKDVKDWGPHFAFWLFAGILMWEELWDLPNNGALSSGLLALITAGATISSVFFEQRMWCKHLCPIGVMCGAFGTFGVMEIRSWKGVCDGCTLPTCTLGTPDGQAAACSAMPLDSATFESLLIAPGTGHLSPNTDSVFASLADGCPVHGKPNQLTDNYDCVMCFNCVKGCDHATPELNLRPPGLDYGLPWFGLNPSAPRMASQVELRPVVGAVTLLLLGSAFVHSLHALVADLGLHPTIADALPAWTGAAGVAFAQHSLATAGGLAMPSLAAAAVHSLGGLFDGSGVQTTRKGPQGLLKGWVDAAYGYMPLAWGGLTAQWLDLGLMEGGTVPVRLSHMLSNARTGEFMAGVQPFWHAPSDQTSAAISSVLVLASIPVSWTLTEKLCREGGVARATAVGHVLLQGALAAGLIHLIMQV